MHKAIFKTSYLILAIAVSPALAQTVSDEGAKQVTNALASYLGPAAAQKSILTVKVDGSAYRVSLDLQKASEEANGTIKAAPLTFLTTPKADGTWDVKADGNSDIIMTPKAEGKAKPTQLSFKNFTMQGIFDPKLGTFSKANMKFGGLGVTASDGDSAMTAEYANLVSDMTAVPANGGATIALVQSADGLVETIKGDAGDITIKIGAIKGDSKIDAMRAKDLLGMWAFFIANATESDLSKVAPQFKDKLMAALPLWQNAVMNVSAKDIEVGTMMGSVKIAEFQEKFSLSGMIPKGVFGATFKVKGIEVPAGMAPTWAKAIIPTDLDIAADIADVNLDAASRLFVNSLDFTKTDPLSDQAAQMIGLAILGGKPKITLSPSSLKSESLKVSVKGSGGFAPLPGGKVTIEAEGLDETLKTLSSSDDEKAKQAVASFGIAKALAQESGGKHVWVVEGDASGKITVNGKSLSGQ